MFNVLIVGGGRGGVTMLSMLHTVPEIEIIGVVDVNADAPGIVKAKSLGIPVWNDLLAALQIPNLNIVANVTGSEKVNELILANKPATAVLADAIVCTMMYKLAQHQDSLDEKLREQVTELTISVDDAKKYIQNTAEVISFIKKISEQTKMLGLNASIEAARAGEQGRGFSVVANEVTKLAENSGEATAKISTILKNIELSMQTIIEGIEKTSVIAKRSTILE